MCEKLAVSVVQYKSVWLWAVVTYHGRDWWPMRRVAWRFTASLESAEYVSFLFTSYDKPALTFVKEN